MNFDNFTIKAQEVLQQAAQIASGNGQQAIETGHMLKAVLESDENIKSFINKKLGVNDQTLNQKLDDILSRYPKVSGGGNPYLSNDAHQAVTKAQNYLKEFDDEYVAVEHLLLGILGGKDQVARLMKDQGYNEKDLKKAIHELRGGKKVTDKNAEEQYQALKKYSKDLTELAEQGKLDPVIGRDDEIRRVLQILSRRTKNNPMLIGEAGVGKTAIVEGLAQRIVAGDAPETLKDRKVVALDMGQLVAGAKYKGEFEERLKSVIKEVSDSEGQIIMFIDEIHTLIGAGSGGESAMDAANLLKPALARGELHAIGATTLKEYQKHIENDKALERRFQTVIVDEPTVEDAISILRGLKEKYEVHHGVRIKDEAIIGSAELSHRYLTERYLPDKAIDLMDEAASKMRIEIDSLPAELDELERRIMQLEIEKEAIKREGDKEKEESLSKQIADLNEEKNKLKAQWENEKEVIQGLQREKENIEQYKHEAEQAEREGDYGKVAELRYGKIKEAEEKVKEYQDKIEEMRGESPLLKEEVTYEDIAEVVAKWTGIPVSKMLQSEREKLLHLEEELHKRVAGQEEAIHAVADAVRRSRAGLQDPNRPIGSFIFLGTTGVGKTEVARSLADYLFSDESNMTRIDMSEYQERHSVSRLVGAPPGYVGYDEGGQLTEAVRKKPYSVILLDEIEKAHHDVFNILLQVLDDGRLTDNKGRTANFKNTIIIMTSNVGSHIIQQNFDELKRKEDYSEEEEKEVFEKTKNEVLETLKQNLRPEFLNRIDETIMFKPLNKGQLRKIVLIQFKEIQKRLEDNGIQLEGTDQLFDVVGERGWDPQFGARPLKRVLQRDVLNPLSKEILSGNIKREDKIVADVDENGNIVFNNVPKEERQEAEASTA